MKRKFVLRGLALVAVTLAISIGASGSQSVVYAQDTKPQTATYGEIGGEKLVLDVYQPATSDKPLPAVLLIHGGGGSFGDRTDLAEYSQALAAAGYVAFNIEYRLVQDGKNLWPAQFEDAQLAVRWVRDNAAKYNVDSDRICALGHSFGGRLAALLGERDTPKSSDLSLGNYSSRVACVIDIAGSVNPLQPMKAEDATLDVALMGGTAKEKPELYKDASALAQVDSKTSPFLIFHGTDDEMVPVEESRLLVDALHTAGVEVIYVEYPHATHFYWLNFFKPSDRWNKVSLETLAFLSRHLHPTN